MIANRALLRCLVALDYRAAIAALPLVHANANPYFARFDVLRELAVALLVTGLDFGDFAEFERDVLEAFSLGFFGEALVHIGPFLMLAGSGGEKVLGSRLYPFKELEPHLGVLLLVESRFLENRRDLFVAILLGLRSVIIVLIARLRLAGKCRHEVLFGLRSFQFHFLFSFFGFSFSFLLLR